MCGIFKLPILSGTMDGMEIDHTCIQPCNPHSREDECQALTFEWSKAKEEVEAGSHAWMSQEVSEWLVSGL